MRDLIWANKCHAHLSCIYTKTVFSKEVNHIPVPYTDKIIFGALCLLGSHILSGTLINYSGSGDSKQDSDKTVFLCGQSSPGKQNQ